jgi:hypothetical protein
MDKMNCNSIKQSLIDRLAADIEVTALHHQCVLTLPLKTLDDRLTDVFVEEKLGDMFLVHDAGMTTSQLFAQGIHLTESKNKLLSEIARRLGVIYKNGMFQVACKGQDVEASVFAVGQCIGFGMLEVASHKPTFEEEPVLSIVQRTLDNWKPDEIGSIPKRFSVKGKKASHQFEFVVFSKAPEVFQNIAVKVLPPSYSPQWQSERYGFLALDIEGTIYDQWKRLAIVTRAEEWGREPLKLVHSLSSQVLEFRGGDEYKIEEHVPRAMNMLLKTA